MMAVLAAVGVVLALVVLCVASFRFGMLVEKMRQDQQ
jgi:uncharacterized membrane protein